MVFRNNSGKVTAEIEVSFGQHVDLSAFTRLYESLHRNGTLGNMTVFVVADNSKSANFYVVCCSSLFSSFILVKSLVALLLPRFRVRVANDD